MRASTLKYTLLSLIASLIMVIIVLLPFHAFLTVWASSLIGHYTALRLWKEVLLIICGLGVLYLLLTDGKIRSFTLSRRLVWLIVAYALVNIIWGVVALQHHSVTRKALGYGLIVNLRFLAFFLCAWAIALRTNRLRAQWPKLLLIPAAIVVAFGLLQIFVLRQNFLSHFGYGSRTIEPYETINHNMHYVRILSTLRGANPLGAYMLLPISALTAWWVKRPGVWRNGLFLLASLIVLFFSFSRSAWLGAALAVAVIIVLELHARFSGKLLPYLVIAIIALGLAGFALRNNTRFQNIVFHTQAHTTAKSSSDQGHAVALRGGLRDLAHEPLGRGPGTAGPASIYNNGKARIAENYFIQIGQETGWLGLALFLLINVGVGYLLWLRRDDVLALSLFASFIGLSFIGLLAHVWTDDTIAYVWWGLAGIAMAPVTTKTVTKSRHGSKNS